MSGRVTRKNPRRRNSVYVEWYLCSNKPVGECQEVTHEKEFARLLAEFQLFGPFDGVRALPCDCEFILLPVPQAS